MAEETRWAALSRVRWANHGVLRSDKHRGKARKVNMALRSILRRLADTVWSAPL
jgi:hypothetical protein